MSVFSVHAATSPLVTQIDADIESKQLVIWELLVLSNTTRLLPKVASVSRIINTAVALYLNNSMVTQRWLGSWVSLVSLKEFDWSLSVFQIQCLVYQMRIPQQLQHLKALFNTNTLYNMTANVVKYKLLFKLDFFRPFWLKIDCSDSGFQKSKQIGNIQWQLVKVGLSQ